MNLKYSLGIDLGTSNSTMSLANIENDLLIDIPIQQISEANTVESLPSLASLAYYPNSETYNPDAFELPGDSPKHNYVIGSFAREQGAKEPDRLVSSTKSWLCNQHIDHQQPILPWQSKSVDKKISPIDASRLYLEHLIYAYQFHAKLENTDQSLENTQITLTVPASFDEMARSLTCKAAESAGISNVILMEEPQAAFYAWLVQAGSTWREQVSPGDIILVCDVGGGTSDFSLIAVSEENGDLTLERISVGEHILLGGDNLDLALAHILRQQLEEEEISIDDWQFLSLVHAARIAKEQLFNDEELDEVPVAIPSRGSSLFTQSVSTNLSRKVLQYIVLDGFLPLSEVDDMPEKCSSVGLQEFGLCYESDPVLSKHLARFLARSLDNVKSNPSLSKKFSKEILSGPLLPPTAVLLNGGFFNAEAARTRLIKLLEHWSDGQNIRKLSGSDYNRAVSRGAAFYGLNKLSGSGIRVKAGTSRSYYIGLESQTLAIPGFKPPLKALCVVPQGMEEGTEKILDSKDFGLVTGESVTFRFFSSEIRAGDNVGTIIPNAIKDLEETAELQTELTPLKGKTAGEIVPVHLHAKVTEIGILDLWMQHTQSKQKWKLEFSVRTE